MGLTKATLFNEAAQRHQLDIIEVVFKYTSVAGALSFYAAKPDITFSFVTPATATAELGQTTIDNLLGTAGIVNSAVSFGATAMTSAASNILGFVLGCSGQFRELYFAELEVTNGTGLVVTPSILKIDAVAYSTTSFPNTALSAPAARVGLLSTGDVIFQGGVSPVGTATAAAGGQFRVRFCGRFK